ncbi:hypothetical protein Q7P36_009960 [Cladosporium allicinum]
MSQEHRNCNTLQAALITSDDTPMRASNPDATSISQDSVIAQAHISSIGVLEWIPRYRELEAHLAVSQQIERKPMLVRVGAESDLVLALCNYGWSVVDYEQRHNCGRASFGEMIDQSELARDHDTASSHIAPEAMVVVKAPATPASPGSFLRRNYLDDTDGSTENSLGDSGHKRKRGVEEQTGGNNEVTGEVDGGPSMLVDHGDEARVDRDLESQEIPKKNRLATKQAKNRIRELEESEQIANDRIRELEQKLEL